MPTREIRRRFTKSDMAIMGWRSAEVSANMRDRTYRGLKSSDIAAESGAGLFENVERDEMLKGVETRLGGIVYKMTDERGNVDLRRLTGDEAFQYMRALNIPVVKMG